LSSAILYYVFDGYNKIHTEASARPGFIIYGRSSMDEILFWLVFYTYQYWYFLPIIIGGITYILGRISGNTWVRALANVGGVIALVSLLLVAIFYGPELLNRFGL